MEGEVIFRYTVEQAVEDGVLYDARELRGPDRRDEAGEIFRQQWGGVPVYLTSALYDLIDRAVRSPRYGNDWAGVCWDVAFMGRPAVAAAYRQAQARGIGRATFVVIITGAGRVRNHRLDAVISGDGLTFCLEGED